MNFVFPVFVRASNDTSPPAPPQKSLWQLVAEAGPNGAMPDRVTQPRVTSKHEEGHCREKNGQDTWMGGGDNAAAACMSEDCTNGAANCGLTLRSSWKPAKYMVDNLMSSGFVSQFAMLHGIECSARLPLPPCLRPQDLQLPPPVLARLQRQLRLPRSGREPLSAKFKDDSKRPDLNELREIVFCGAAILPCDDGELERFVGNDAVGSACDCGKYAPDGFLLTALQQFTVTSMLLGHHTLSIGPRGVGKRTIGFLATGALTLARIAHKVNDMTTGADNDSNNNNSLAQINRTTSKETCEALLMRSSAPHALIIVSSYNEVRQCNQWLQGVFTAGAFTPMTFSRGTSELVLLPIDVQEESRNDRSFLQTTTLQQLSAVPPAPSVVNFQKEQPPCSRVARDPDDGCRIAPRKYRHHSRGRSQSLREHGRGRRRRHRSFSRHHSRPRSSSKLRSHRRRRNRSHHSRHGRRRRDEDDASLRGRGRGGERRHGSRSRRASRDKKRERKEKEKANESFERAYCREQSEHDCFLDCHRKERSHEKVPKESSYTQELVDDPHKPLDIGVGVFSTANCGGPLSSPICEETPSCLQRHVPILIASQQSLVEALQVVHGQAEMLPLESVRIVCISDADRIAQPTSQASVPTSWWVSLSNAVDVECQYIVSASRMYDEVDGWLQETLLRETPDVVNRYRQRDDTVWCGIDHIVEVVCVDDNNDDEEGERVVKQFFERVDAAKVRRLFSIVLRHFSLSHARNVDRHTVVHCSDHVTAIGSTNTDNNNNNNNGNGDTDDMAFLTSQVGRVVVVVASRKEQEFVFQQLFSGLSDCAGRVRCTCNLQDFCCGEADVLVTYDWVLCFFDDADMFDFTVGKVVNFGLPRALLAPGKEESLLECITIRTRALLHHKIRDESADETDGNNVGGNSLFTAAGARLSVVTLLTERQNNGRIGRLLASRAQAQTLG